MSLSSPAGTPAKERPAEQVVTVGVHDGGTTPTWTAVLSFASVAAAIGPSLWDGVPGSRYREWMSDRPSSERPLSGDRLRAFAGEVVDWLPSEVRRWLRLAKVDLEIHHEPPAWARWVLPWSWQTWVRSSRTRSSSLSGRRSSPPREASCTSR